MILVALSFIVGGITKVIQSPDVITELNTIGFSGWAVYLGIIEFIIIAVYLYRPTMVVGFGLGVAYLGGAIAATIGGGSSPLPAFVAMALLWIATYLRRPSLLRS